MAKAGVVFIDFSLLLDPEDPGGKEAVEQCMNWLKSEKKFVLALTAVWYSHGNHPSFEDLMSSCCQTNRLFQWAHAARHLLDVIFECRLAPPTEPENIDKPKPNGKPLVAVSRNRRVEQSPKEETQSAKKKSGHHKKQAQRINDSPELLDKAIALLKLDLRCSNARLGHELGVSPRSVGFWVRLYACDFKKGRKFFSADFLKQLEERRALLVSPAFYAEAEKKPDEKTRGAKYARRFREKEAQRINDSPDLLDKAIALLQRDPCCTKATLERELGVSPGAVGIWLKLYGCDFSFKEARWVFPADFLEQLEDRKALLVSPAFYAEAEKRTVAVSQNRNVEKKRDEETQGAKWKRRFRERQAQQINDNPDLLGKAIALLKRDPCCTNPKLGSELGVSPRSVGVWLKLYACDFSFKNGRRVFPADFLKKLEDRKASLVSLQC